MKKRIILVTLSMACISSSCTTTTGYVPPEVSFDTKLRMISLEGFRIEMSASLAKQVAEERGYKIDSSISDITFDDIVDGERGEIGGSNIYLERDHETIKLSFDYGRLFHVTHIQFFSQHQQEQVEKLLEWYFKRYPELTLSNETETFKAYEYKPNKLASIVVTVKILDENVQRVSITVYDRNYAQCKRNQEYYEEIKAIRRRY